MSVLSKIDDIPIKAKVVCLSALSCTTIVGLSAVGYIGMDKADGFVIHRCFFFRRTHGKLTAVGAGFTAGGSVDY